MTTKLKIDAKKRDLRKDGLTALRNKGFVPAVIYGSHIASTALYFDHDSAELILDKEGKASVISCLLEGEKEPRNVIVQDLQYDKLTDKLLHIDLYEVNMKKEIETEIPLNFVGTSLAVKDAGGVLVKNAEEIQVKCLPADLPEQIEVNIDSLVTFEDMIHISDLLIPEGVEVLNEAEEVIAMVSKPRSEQEIEALDEEITEDVAGVTGVEDKEEPKEGEEEKGEGEEGDKKPEEGSGDEETKKPEEGKSESKEEKKE